MWRSSDWTVLSPARHHPRVKLLGISDHASQDAGSRCHPRKHPHGPTGLVETPVLSRSGYEGSDDASWEDVGSSDRLAPVNMHLIHAKTFSFKSHPTKERLAELDSKKLTPLIADKEQRKTVAAALKGIASGQVGVVTEQPPLTRVGHLPQMLDANAPGNDEEKRTGFRPARPAWWNRDGPGLAGIPRLSSYTRSRGMSGIAPSSEHLELRVPGPHTYIRLHQSRSPKNSMGIHGRPDSRIRCPRVPLDSARLHAHLIDETRTRAREYPECSRDEGGAAGYAGAAERGRVRVGPEQGGEE
jgi:hypothetical protein